MSTQIVSKINWSETLKGLKIGETCEKENPTYVDVDSARARASFFKKKGYLFLVSVADKPFLRITCLKKP